MLLKEIGTVLLFLVVIIVLGNLWFHFVEAVLDRVRRLFTSRKEPPAWHPFPTEEDKDDV